MSKCELEDIVDVDAYLEIPDNEFDINVNTNQFKQRKSRGMTDFVSLPARAPVVLTKISKNK